MILLIFIIIILCLIAAINTAYTLMVLIMGVNYLKCDISKVRRLYYRYYNAGNIIGKIISSIVMILIFILFLPSIILYLICKIIQKIFIWIYKIIVKCCFPKL